MRDKFDLISDLEAIGLKSDDTVLVHSSMKKIGEVYNGADAVINALMTVVSKGMLVLPTHTWASVNENHTEYNPEKEPACVGIIPNLFLQRDGVVRSLHPTHSIAAYSSDLSKAKKFVSGEENKTTPCSRQGVYGKLYDVNAKILLIGVGLNRNTYMHGVEEWFGITERLTEQSLNLTIDMPDGSTKSVHMKKHFKPNGISISEYYIKLEKEFIERGAAVKGKIGDAESILLSARKIADISTEHLMQERDFFTHF